MYISTTLLLSVCLYFGKVESKDSSDETGLDDLPGANNGPNGGGPLGGGGGPFGGGRGPFGGGGGPFGKGGPDREKLMSKLKEILPNPLATLRSIIQNRMNNRSEGNISGESNEQISKSPLLAMMRERIGNRMKGS